METIDEFRLKRNNILKQVSDKVVKEVPLNIVFNLLLGELRCSKTLFYKYKKDKNKLINSPCCHGDGFVIHKNTNLFKCYSCGQSGSSITLTRLIFNCSKHTAVNWLINRFRINIKDIVTDYTKMHSLETFIDWCKYEEELKKDSSDFLPF